MRASLAMIDLVAELQGLRPGERRALLARLEPGERQRIEGQLAKLAKRPEPSFDALACLSPWLAESLAEARSGDKGNLPLAPRDALIEAERLLPSAKPAREAKPSLLDRFLARTRKG